MTFEEWFDSTGPWPGDSRDMGDAWNASRENLAFKTMTAAEIVDLFIQLDREPVALVRALESRVLAERKEPECTCNSNPHAETCPVTAHVRTLLKESGETAWAKANGYAAVTNFGDPVLAHPTPDDARDDTKRLDLLISQEGLRIEKSSDGYVVWDCRNGLEIAGEGNTAREALDAAIDRARQDTDL